MPLVRIVKNWTWPDLRRQSPGGSGAWGDVRFTEDPVEECDYAVVLNKPREDTRVRCPRDHIWAIMQEPPNEKFAKLHRADGKPYARVYTTDPALTGAPYRPSQPALPWHVDRDYDFLSACPVPAKGRSLSWITSNKTHFPGHRDRMEFLERIRGRVDFDLFGKGFEFVQDKWDALAPYRYAIVVENYRGPLYWSEKVADCFLSWTFPIYCGCTRLGDYFPPESFLEFDLRDPRATDSIRRVVESGLWEERLNALAEARRRVLDEYQMLPFLAREIERHEREEGCRCAAPRRATVLSPKPRRLATRLCEALRGVWR